MASIKDSSLLTVTGQLKVLSQVWQISIRNYKPILKATKYKLLDERIDMPNLVQLRRPILSAITDRIIGVEPLIWWKQARISLFLITNSL
jgi:hypothetical protein